VHQEFQENLLGHILGIILIGHEIPGYAINPLPVRLEEHMKGVSISNSTLL
jgi:hypothetical protein